MSTTSEQHAEHLDREQAEGQRCEAEIVEQQWRDLDDLVRLGLPLDPPPSPEDEETFPPDPERTAA